MQGLASHLELVHVQSLHDGTVPGQHMQTVCSSTLLRSVRLACVNEQDGRSCLTWACEGGHLDIAKYLCELGGEEMLMRQSEVRMCVIYGWYHMHVHRDMQGLVGALGAHVRNQRSIHMQPAQAPLLVVPSLHFHHSIYTVNQHADDGRTLEPTTRSSHHIHVSQSLHS